ncbi:hypothetical protein H0W80_04830 [Candidatus Saccharibacteria bacterium]|nr:hypothetical protein [Candidatus Saccharibacteria bacterium]
MKKLVVVTALLFALLRVAPVSAQTGSECSSIEQKSGEAPVITGTGPPANILMSALGTDDPSDDFRFVVEANPGYSLDFIQLVYNDSVGTRIVMPDAQSNFTTGWQTDASGAFKYYKVSGCFARQASTTTTSTELLPLPSGVLECLESQHVVQNADSSLSCVFNSLPTPTSPNTSKAASAVSAKPVFTG